MSPGRAGSAEVGAASSAARQRSYGHGVHCWTELRTSDVQRATRFYAGVFGWTATEAGTSDGQPYATLHLGRVPLAGVSARTDTAAAAGKGDPAFWRLYAAVVGGRAAGDGGRAAGDGGRAAGDGGRAAGDGGRAAGDGGRAAGAAPARASTVAVVPAARATRKPARSTGGRPSAPRQGCPPARSSRPSGPRCITAPTRTSRLRSCSGSIWTAVILAPQLRSATSSSATATRGQIVRRCCCTTATPRRQRAASRS